MLWLREASEDVFDCVSSPLAPLLDLQTCKKKKKTELLRGGQTISGDAVLHFVLQDKHTSSGNDIDEFVVFLLFVCSEEVSGACGDQTTLEDLVRIYFIFLFFYLILLYIPTFYTLARMS